jgi:hypothetical protein
LLAFTSFFTMMSFEGILASCILSNLLANIPNSCWIRVVTGPVRPDRSGSEFTPAGPDQSRIFPTGYNSVLNSTDFTTYNSEIDQWLLTSYLR